MTDPVLARAARDDGKIEDTVPKRLRPFVLETASPRARLAQEPGGGRSEWCGALEAHAGKELRGFATNKS